MQTINVSSTSPSSQVSQSQQVQANIRQRSPSPRPSSVSSFWIARSQEEIVPEAPPVGRVPTFRELYGHNMNRGFQLLKRVEFFLMMCRNGSGRATTATAHWCFHIVFSRINGYESSTSSVPISRHALPTHSPNHSDEGKHCSLLC